MDGDTVETVSDFISGGSKITADGDCSHEIKRRLLLGRKGITNLDSIFKSRDITLPSKEIQAIHPKGNQLWVFIENTDAEAPILWPPHAKGWLIGKDSDVGRDWGQEEKGMTEDEMAGWHHGLGGREFEWTPGVGDGQGGLACCSSWGRKESDMTEQLNWTEHIYMEFRKMVTMTLYARQQKRHRCIEQSFVLCGRGRGLGWFRRRALEHV